VNNDIKFLISLFPSSISQVIENTDDLVEIITDLGRPLELRYLNDEFQVWEDTIITQEDLDTITSNVGAFGADNRAGVDGCLHRISKVVNRLNKTIGFTIRIGRPFIGTTNAIKDIVDSGKNILLVGKPGAGKSSRLRDIARYLSSELYKRVLVVDSSNELAGDGDIPHAAIGRARRLQVPFGKTQLDVMIEAIENHYPEVLCCDEISNYQEAEAARSAVQKGIQLIATAHGNHIEDLINNPPLTSLIGGINSVTLSDESMELKGLQKKSILERKFEPPFDIIIEIDNFDSIAIHNNVKDTVDAYLSGAVYWPEQRVTTNGETKITKLGKIMYKNEDSTIKRKKNG
jgi:stage III sporulation protein SpoIIIAA